MRKIFILSSFFLMIGFAVSAQNVGIGVANPTEKLDVDGNVQFSGALMPGGSAGTSGQLLQSNGPGAAPTWVNPPQGGGGGPVDLTGKANYLGRWSAAGDTLIHGNVQDDSTQVAITTVEDALPTANLNNFVTIVAPGSGAQTLDNQRIALHAEGTDTVAVNAFITGDEGGSVVRGVHEGRADFVRGAFFSGGAQDASQPNFAWGVQATTTSDAPGFLTFGLPNPPTITSAGVYGINGGGLAHGVQGIALTDTSAATGVYAFKSPATTAAIGGGGAALVAEDFGANIGILAVSTELGEVSANGFAVGLRAVSLGVTENSSGVEGWNIVDNPPEPTHGVLGLSFGITDSCSAVKGVISTANTPGAGEGNVYAVYGDNSVEGGTSPAGVFGRSIADVDSAAGVFGVNDKTLGAGIIGASELGVGVRGVHGRSETSSGNGNAGVHGMNYSEGSSVFGNSVFAPAVRGQSFATAGFTYGVMGESSSGEGGSAGIAGFALGDNQTEAVFGVYGSIGSGSVTPSTVNANSAGVYGQDDGSGNGWAGYFNGAVNIDGNTVINNDIDVTGTLTAGTKNFVIDHPLDPQNKILRHFSIESNQAMTIYAGSVTTDQNGEAVVQLPAYFEALNKNFRYNLTCVNQFAQAIVAKKVENNAFTVRTDKANVEVSWVIYAERDDAFMRNYPLEIESDKAPEHRGKYLHPEAFEQPASNGIRYVDSDAFPKPKTGTHEYEPTAPGDPKENPMYKRYEKILKNDPHLKKYNRRYEPKGELEDKKLIELDKIDFENPESISNR